MSLTDGKLERHFAIRTGSPIRWSNDGREIFYVDNAAPRVMAVAADGKRAPRVVADFPEDEGITFGISPDDSLVVARQSSSRTAVLIRDFR